MTIGLLTFQSCSDKDQKVDDQNQTVMQTVTQTSLAGKIYCFGDPIDTNKCEYIPIGTDYYSEYVFLDDSVFFTISHNCCPDIGEKDYGEDFATEVYQSGKYKIDEKELNLNFNPFTVVFYIKAKINPKSDTTLEKTHVEIEKVKQSTDKLFRFNCKNIPFFQHKIDAKAECLAPTNDTHKKYIDRMKTENVWDKLFGKN